MLAHDLSFFAEPTEDFGIVAMDRHLDYDFVMVPFVESFPNNPHPAFTNSLNDLITIVNNLAGFKFHATCRFFGLGSSLPKTKSAKINRAQCLLEKDNAIDGQTFPVFDKSIRTLDTKFATEYIQLSIQHLLSDL